MCPNCRAFISSDDRTCPYCGIALRGPAQVASPSEGGLIPEHAFTTFMLLLINAAIWAISIMISKQDGNPEAIKAIDGQTLLLLGAKYGPYIRQSGEWWRLFTAGFLHGGLLHIVMNGWAILQIGRTIDVIYGSARYLVIFFVGSVTGFWLSMVVSPGSVSVGASAGLCGLVGSLIAVGFLSRSSVAAEMRQASVRSAIFILITGFLSSLMGWWPIDNMAHLGGLGGGFAAAMIVGLPRPAIPARERLWTLAAWICVLLTVFSFYQMLMFYTKMHQTPLVPPRVTRELPRREVY
jgi:rhomboid protease GluP